MIDIGRRSFLLGAAAAGFAPRAFAQGQADPVRIPFTLTDRRVLVECTVAGRGPYRFVLDTGGELGLLDANFVRTLGLRRVGQSRLSLSTGAGTFPVHEAPEIVFGGVILQPSAAFAAVPNFNFGDGAVGSLAAGVLSAVNGELDYGAREWRIHPTAPPRPGWTRFDRGIVRAANRNGSSFLFGEAEIGGQRLRLGLDTGMTAGVRMYRRAAEQAGLWNAPRWSPAAPEGRTRIVRAPALTVAGSTIERPLVSIMETPQWSIFDQGLLGLPVLRRFDMATEVGTGALYLKRNGQAPVPERYNRSGLWITRGRDGLSVGAVGGGSPSEAAGLAVGDRLVGGEFGRLVEQIQGAAGTRIALTVARGGTQRNVSLTLADYL